MQRLIYVTVFICLSFSPSMHAANNTLAVQLAIGEQSLMRYLHGKIYGAFGTFLTDGMQVNYAELIQKNPALTLELVFEEEDVPTVAEQRILDASQPIEQIFSTSELEPVLDKLGALVVVIKVLMEEFNEGELTPTEFMENLLDNVDKQQAQRLQAAIALLEGHRQLFVDYSIAIAAGEDSVEAKQELADGYADLLAAHDSIVSEQDRAEMEAVLALADYRGGIATEAELETAELPQNPLRALVLELSHQD